MTDANTEPRILLGLAGGALTGAVFTSLYFVVDGLLDHTEDLIANQWPLLVLAFIVSAAIWGMGLVAIGLPVWICLEHFERRHWFWAMSVGGVLTFVAVYLFAWITAIFWHRALLASFAHSVIGAAVSFVVWRIAYRPTSEEADSR
jgi:hypothetical protein